MLKVASIRTGLCSGSEVGYLKVTLLKLIDCSSVKCDLGAGEFLISGTRSITSNISTPRVFAATIAYMFGNAAINPTKPVMRAIIV